MIWRRYFYLSTVSSGRGIDRTFTILLEIKDQCLSKELGHLVKQLRRPGLGLQPPDKKGRGRFKVGPGRNRFYWPRLNPRFCCSSLRRSRPPCFHQRCDVLPSNPNAKVRQASTTWRVASVRSSETTCHPEMVSPFEVHMSRGQIDRS